MMAAVAATTANTCHQADGVQLEEGTLTLLLLLLVFLLLLEVLPEKGK